MIEQVKLLLGEAATNYTEAQIGLALKIAIAEVEDYCNRELDYGLELQALKIAVIKLNRIGTEGIATQSFIFLTLLYSNRYLF